MLCLCFWHMIAVKFSEGLLNIMEVWLKKMMSRMWNIAAMVLLCVWWISNLGRWGMSVGEEQKEITVFCHQRKSKLSVKGGSPNYEVMGDPLAQVTLRCCCIFSDGLPGCWSLLQALLVPFTGDSHLLKNPAMVLRGQNRALVCPPVCGQHYRVVV